MKDAMRAALALALCLALVAPADAGGYKPAGDKTFTKASQDAIVVAVCFMLFLIIVVASLNINPETFAFDVKVFLGLESSGPAETATAPPSRNASTADLEKMDEPADDPNATFEDKARKWFRKYFLEGQMLEAKAVEQLDNLESLPPMERFFVQNRKMISICIPALIFHLVWWPTMIAGNYWEYFNSKYYMSITMVFGSMFAGCTSEGGAAVAFPVMTLVFDISPSIARDFSFMIQSQGMTAAAFTIFLMKVKLEWRSIFYCSISGLAGMWLGLEEVAPRMDPPVKKIFFVCTWAAFAASLYMLNRTKNRHTFVEIPDFKPWKALVLIVCGFIGGIFSSIAGSGIDICSFAVLTLLFRVTEKTATPTSVVLMGVNTVVGFFIREFSMGGVEPEAWKFLMVCMPIVVFGAPLGSYLGSHLHRLVLAWLVYILDFVQLVGAYALVDFEGTGYPELPYIGIAIVVGGAALFVAMTKAGDYLMLSYLHSEEGGKVQDPNVLASKLEDAKTEAKGETQV